MSEPSEKNPSGGMLHLVAAAAVVLCALCPVLAPAQTLGDQTGSSQLPAVIDDSVPDDAVLVSSEYALLDSGELVSVADGSIVADSDLVGTQDTPPDPLALTGSTRFARMTVAEAREQLEETGITLLSLDDGEYGAYWGTSSNTSAFFMGDGTMFVCQAKGVVDVSEHNGTIDWEKAKAAGVEGAIIRIGYGTARMDYQAERNISECKRLGIPFGVYIYSYADNDDLTGLEEGAFTVSLLQQLGVSADDLSLPIYYDLEQWTWSGHTPPTDSATYDTIVSEWFSQVQGAGYENASVYSYTSYLNGPLNSTYIHARTTWVAHYSSKITYSDFQTVFRGWQYTSAGTVDGIGACDLSAFGNGTYVAGQDDWLTVGVNVTALEVLTCLPDGAYYINSTLQTTSGIGLSSTGSTELQDASHSSEQVFYLFKQSDGSYVIAEGQDASDEEPSSPEGLDVLDVENGNAVDGAQVRLYEYNGTDAQRWYIRSSGSGYYIQSALGNWVLNVSEGLTAFGTPITLCTPDGTDAQKFVLASAGAAVTTDVPVRIVSCADASFVLDVRDGSTSNGACCQLWQANGTDAQAFYVREVGNGVYELVNVKSNKLVEVASGYTENGSTVSQYTKNGSASQRWAVIDWGDGALSFVGMKSGKALDVPSGSASNGVGLQIYSPNDTKAQRWTLEETVTSRQELDALAKEHAEDLADGTYLVSSSLAVSKVLDVASGSSQSGANVQLYATNGSSAQRWEVTHDGDYVVIANAGSGKVLDVASGLAQSGANVQQYASNSSYAQRWVAQKNDDGSYTLISALDSSLVLDVSAGSFLNGANVQLYASNGTAAQSFVLSSIQDGQTAMDVLASLSSGTLSEGVYQIASSKSGSMVIDVSSGSKASGANVQLYASNGTDAQRWQVSIDAAGYVTLTNVGSGLVLDVSAGIAASGQNVQQYAGNGTRAQKWVAVREGSKTVLYSALGGGYVLDVAAGSMSNGANVQLYSANDSAAQGFVLVAS